MSDKRKYRVYIKFEEDYKEVYAKDEDEAQEKATNYFLATAPIETLEIEELQRRDIQTITVIYSYCLAKI